MEEWDNSDSSSSGKVTLCCTGHSFWPDLCPLLCHHVSMGKSFLWWKINHWRQQVKSPILNSNRWQNGCLCEENCGKRAKSDQARHLQDSGHFIREHLQYPEAQAQLQKDLHVLGTSKFSLKATKGLGFNMLSLCSKHMNTCSKHMNTATQDGWMKLSLAMKPRCIFSSLQEKTMREFWKERNLLQIALLVLACHAPRS